MKPKVLFNGYAYIQEGLPAVIFGVQNHPSPQVTGGDVPTRTSTVERVIERDPDGTIVRFETLNTIYVNNAEI